MKFKKLHNWQVSYKEAVKLQEKFKAKLTTTPLSNRIQFVAGADVSFSKYSPVLFAAVVVLELPELKIVESRAVKAKADFPYIPGLLSFRELPALCRAFEKLQIIPDAVICDGQGIAHPRGFGLAAHLGLILDLPTAGCAKSLLVGEYGSLADKQWATADLKYQGRIVGKAVRSRKGVKPVFVSPGHKIDLAGSIELIRLCTPRYRLPEVIRQAHMLSNQHRLRFS